MNRIISLLCMCAMTLSTFAATYTAKVVITLTSANAEPYEITLREASFLSDGWDNGFDSESPNAEGLYVIANNSKWLQWGTNNLEGVQLGLTTCADEEYTLTFTGVVGSTYKVYDANKNELTLIEEDGTLNFTATPNSTIENRFSILEEAPVFVAQVTTNEFGWASFSFDQDLAAFEPDLQIYTGEFDGVETLNLNLMDWYAQNEGVVVFGEPNTTYHFVAGVPQQSSFDGNDLKASSRWANGHSGSVFCLRGDALYEYTGDEMPANKAFLQISSTPNGAPRRISFRFNGTQAVDNVADEAKAVKFMENGQVFVIKNGVKFNTFGQIVK